MTPARMPLVSFSSWFRECITPESVAQAVHKWLFFWLDVWLVVYYIPRATMKAKRENRSALFSIRLTPSELRLLKEAARRRNQRPTRLIYALVLQEIGRGASQKAVAA